VTDAIVVLEYSNDASKTPPLIRRGKAGQTSSRDFLASVSGIQKRCRFRRHGDPKTRLLHR